MVAAHAPTLAVVETIHSGKDAQATALGHARGVALLVACRPGRDGRVRGAAQKQAVAGTGRADKAQVGEMVRCSARRRPWSDAADALALALAHLKRSDFAHLPGGRGRGSSPLQAAIDKALAAAGPSNAGRRRPMR